MKCRPRRSRPRFHKKHYCRKKKYTPREAHRAIERLNRIQEKRLHVYFCEFHRAFHVGGIPIWRREEIEKGEAARATANVREIEIID
jgi:hypothetical protein